MSRNKQGTKAGRRERHIAAAGAQKERKRQRKARAARYAHLPGQQPRPVAPVAPAVNVGELRSMTVAVLRDMALARGLACTTKTRKADLIAMIEAAS